MAWIYLIVAGCFEVGFTTSLKLSENFSNRFWAVMFFICISLSFHFLNKAIQTIPMGTAYAVWTGIGAVGTVLIGIFIFQEPVTFWRLFFIFLLIGSLVGLKARIRSLKKRDCLERQSLLESKSGTINSST